MADIDQILSNMVKNFDASKAAGVELSVQFDLSGDGGGQWYAKVADSKLDANKGSVEDADATLKMDAGDFAAMSNGDLNPMMAFMSGKIKVDGDLNTVMKFQQVVGL